MRLTATLVTALVLSLIASTSEAPAAPAVFSTMEQCAALLPSGKRYAFAINGTIDFTGVKPILHGDLSVKDEANDDLRQQAGAFAECFAKLVR